MEFFLIQYIPPPPPFFFLRKSPGSLVAKSCLTLCNLVDCSPQGFSVHGILQARLLERVAISFSIYLKLGFPGGSVVKSLLATTTDARQGCEIMTFCTLGPYAGITPPSLPLR